MAAENDGIRQNQQPDASDREIAKKLDVSPPTVAKVRKGLSEKFAEIPQNLHPYDEAESTEKKPVLGSVCGAYARSSRTFGARRRTRGASRHSV